MTHPSAFARAVACHGRITEAPPGMAPGFPGGAGWARHWAEAWVRAPLDGRPATAGTGAHADFLAFVRNAVEGFRHAALAAGAPPQDCPRAAAAFVRNRKPRLAEPRPRSVPRAA